MFFLYEIEGVFHKDFGVRLWNEDIGGDGKIVPVEFLVACDVCNRKSREPFCYGLNKMPFLFSCEFNFAVEEEECFVAAEDFL